MFKISFLKKLFIYTLLIGSAQSIIASEILQEQDTQEVIQQKPSAEPNNSSWLNWISNTMTNTNSIAMRFNGIFWDYY